MKVKIEQADSSVADTLGAIEKIVYSDGKGWPGKMFFNDMNEKNRLYLIAKDNEKIVGFVSANYFMENADILRVAVLPDYQGKDIATQLMKALIDDFRKMQVKKVMLEVNNTNSKAQGLYEKIGFKLIASRKNYYGSGKDGLIYSLTI